eukprot:TRINITY_DN723_c0_g2_i3.p3 TRINITY_DN723_c0_g2~~TRINITY_DN723_c0_g2_i3.p3  ORF type:complete len:157 (-),score=7.82 TRINITY_DN723_c0_g2_i3:75-545(-)
MYVCSCVRTYVTKRYKQNKDLIHLYRKQTIKQKAILTESRESTQTKIHQQKKIQTVRWYNYKLNQFQNILDSNNFGINLLQQKNLHEKLFSNYDFLLAQKDKQPNSQKQQIFIEFLRQTENLKKNFREQLFSQNFFETQKKQDRKQQQIFGRSFQV